MKGREYRFCPRCAGRLEGHTIKEGEPERLVCGRCGFVFYLGPKLVAGAIAELDGGIVLIQRSIEPGYGRWTFPGGFVERGEVAESAAARETLEETGLEIEVGGIVGLYTYEGQIPAIAVFAAKVLRGDPAPLDETLDVRIFPRDGLPWSEMAFPSTERALKDYLRRF
jgi:8-oxo-dGTP diphosphatase